MESKLSDTADVWARLWPDGDPREADDDSRLLEEIASFLARDGDPPRQVSAGGRATIIASSVGTTLGTCVRGRCRRAMVPAKEKVHRSVKTYDKHR